MTAQQSQLETVGDPSEGQTTDRSITESEKEQSGDNTVIVDVLANDYETDNDITRFGHSCSPSTDESQDCEDAKPDPPDVNNSNTTQLEAGLEKSLETFVDMPGGALLDEEKVPRGILSRDPSAEECFTEYSYNQGVETLSNDHQMPPQENLAPQGNADDTLQDSGKGPKMEQQLFEDNAVTDVPGASAALLSDPAQSKELVDVGRELFTDTDDAGEHITAEPISAAEEPTAHAAMPILQPTQTMTSSEDTFETKLTPLVHAPQQQSFEDLLALQNRRSSEDFQNSVVARDAVPAYETRVTPVPMQRSPATRQYGSLEHMDQLISSDSAHSPMRQDTLELLPSLDAAAQVQQQLQHQRVFVRQPIQPQRSFGYTLSPTKSGRRKIQLALQEDVRNKAGFLGHLRQRSRSIVGMHEVKRKAFVDRGTLTVSWFEGTASLELQEHVRRSAMRKLSIDDDFELVDVRFIDETSDPPEEIVLSPCIPDGSRFILRFSLRDKRSGRLTPPESPSAAPSPYPSDKVLGLEGLNANQLALLKMPSAKRPKNAKDKSRTITATPKEKFTNPAEEDDDSRHTSDSELLPEAHLIRDTEDPIETRLRQITELLLLDRQKRTQEDVFRRKEKRQVVFVLANYFVLFLSLIAVSAEINARAAGWLTSLEKQMRNVQDCASDKEALFQCVSNGDFAGLIASVTIWLTRSVATRRIFLFGFESTQKLWTVVYESFVTAFCWGVSYMFIRRAMNPDTRPRFIQKYWKDAVYGSLAGFNAAFLKQVMKNLIPQEAVEDVLRERQLKILSWLPSFD